MEPLPQGGGWRLALALLATAAFWIGLVAAIRALG